MRPAAPSPLALARRPRQTWPVEDRAKRRRWRSCERKKAYPTRQAAVEAAAGCMRRARLLRAYECELCGQWHLTSQRERGNR